MEKKIPARRCVGCKESKDKKELIRIVLTPEKNLELDVTGKKNGRGAYICKNPECLEKAFKTKGLEKAFKMQIPNEFADRLKEELKLAD